MKKLSGLEVNEVSLVGKAANKKKFLIFKNREGVKMPNVSREIQNLINSVDPKLMEKVAKKVKTFKVGKAVAEEGKDSMVGKDGDMMPRKDSAAYKDMNAGDGGADHQVSAHGGSADHQDTAPLSERAQAALKAIARIAAPHKDELHAGHLGSVGQEVGLKAAPKAAPMAAPDKATNDPDAPQGSTVEMGQMAIPEGVSEEHHMAALEKAKGAYGESLQKMGYRQYPDPSLEETNAMEKSKHGLEDDEDEDDEGEDVGKTAVGKSARPELSAFSKEQKAQLETVFKANTELAVANKELVKKNADLEKEIKTERDARVLKEFEAKASTFKHLGANTQELAEVMKSLSETNPKALEKIESVLKSNDEQLRVAAMSGGGLYGEIGSRQGAGGAGDAEAKLDRLVDSVVSKSDGNLSREQIYDEVLKSKEGKALYREMKQTRKGGI